MDTLKKKEPNFSQLRNKLTTVKSEFENSISSLATKITSMAAKLENMDLSPITQNINFPPKDNIKVEVSSIDEGFHSIVKNELESNHTENKTQVTNVQSADDLSIIIKPHVTFLDSVPVPTEESPVTSQEPGPIPTMKEPNISQLGNELTTVKSEFENNISSLASTITSMAAKLENIDLPPITRFTSFWGVSG